MKDAQPPPAVVRLARVESTEKAHIIKQALENLGIQVLVVGDNLEAGFGDLHTIGPELWVRGADLDKAREFIERHEGRHES